MNAFMYPETAKSLLALSRARRSVEVARRRKSTAWTTADILAFRMETERRKGELDRRTAHRDAEARRFLDRAPLPTGFGCLDPFKTDDDLAQAFETAPGAAGRV